jgi:hypothetical protein
MQRAAHLFALLRLQELVPGQPSGAQKQNVPDLKFDLLGACDFLQQAAVDRKSVTRRKGRWPRLHKPFDVKQYPAANNSMARPMLDAQLVLLIEILVLAVHRSNRIPESGCA